MSARVRHMERLRTADPATGWTVYSRPFTVGVSRLCTCGEKGICKKVCTRKCSGAGAYVQTPAT